MKILYVHRDLSGSSVEAAEAKESIYSLSAVNIKICAFYRESETGEITASDTIIDNSYKKNPFIGFIKSLHGFNPDIVHIKSCWTPVHCMAALLCVIYRFPYIVEPGGHFLPVHMHIRFAGRPLALPRKFLKFLFRKLCDEPMVRSSVAIRALSRFESEFCEARYGKKCMCIPLGVNNEWFTIGNMRRMARSCDVIKFLFVGRLDVFQKGLDLIVSSTQILNDMGYHEKFEVNLVGPTLESSSQVLHEMTSKSGLSNLYIKPPVYGDAKNMLFQESHVFLHPSRFEEMAKLPREALASGMPIIASKESNMGDWATEHEFGLDCDLTANSLANAMKQLIDCPEMIEKFSANAFAYAEKTRWGSIAEDLSKHYHALLHK